MIIPGHIFKAYDIRGIFDVTLTSEMATMIGKGVAVALRNVGQSIVIVGRDGRCSGEILCCALIQGLTSSGIDVINLGCVTTPMAYFASYQSLVIGGIRRHVPSCIVVTGSHNPPDYNGFKITINNQALYGDAIRDLLHIINSGKFISGKGKIYFYDISSAYISNIAANIKLARPIDIIVDSGNGIAGAFAPKLFQAIGCQVKALFCDVDGTFPNHHPDPSCHKNLKEIRRHLLGREGEIGLAFDGDGDRLGIVSPDGKIITSDRQLMLFSKYILKIYPGSSVVFDVKCSRLLAPWIESHCGKAVMAPSGHSLMKAKIQNCAAILAGEMSGHMFFSDRWYGFDDGLYAAARLLELLSSKKNINVLMDGIPDSYRSPEYAIDCSEGESHQLMILISNHAYFGAGVKKIEIDGLRIEYDDGFGLVRSSNTMPALTMHFEGDSKNALRRIKKIFKTELKPMVPGKIWPY